MNTEEAIKIILSEAHPGVDSLLSGIRNGEDPGAERMRRLVSALQTVFQLLSGQPDLDRKLAAALFTLGSDVPLTISSLATKGRGWRKGFMEEEVYELLMGVQSIFEDRWLEPLTSESVH